MSKAKPAQSVLVLSSMFRKLKNAHFGRDVTGIPQDGWAKCTRIPPTTQANSGAISGEGRLALDIYQRSGKGPLQRLIGHFGDAGQGAWTEAF